MPNPLQTAWSYLRGDDFHTDGAIAAVSGQNGGTGGAIAAAVQRAAFDNGAMQQKFTPASAGVDWQRVQSLVYTFSGTSTQGGDFNSAVFACLMALALGSIEPPLRVWRETAINKREPVDHALTTRPDGLLIKPNFFHRMRELRFWKTWCQHLDGNAYLLKIRAGDPVTGNVIEYWPISPTIIRPYTEEGSPNYIDGYRRFVGKGKGDNGSDYTIDPVDNIIHFRLGLDDRDHRLGLAPIKRLVREIASDEAATRWTDRMLAIGGAASMLVSLPNDTTLSPDEIEDMRDRIEQRFTGERVGAVGVLSGGATADRYGFSPQEMDLSALHNVPETRVCAVIGVHPAVAMMGAGLSQTANYSSLKEIYIAFTERKLTPLWSDDEDTLNQSLLPDFNSDPKLLIAHDLSEVRALQEDVNALWTRVVNAYDKGLLTVNQALPLLGLEPVDDDEGDLRKGTPKPAAPALDEAPVNDTEEGAPAEEREAQPVKRLHLKATDLDRWPEMMDALLELAVPAFAADLERHFDAQRRRTKRSYLGKVQ